MACPGLLDLILQGAHRGLLWVGELVATSPVPVVIGKTWLAALAAGCGLVAYHAIALLDPSPGRHTGRLR